MKKEVFFTACACHYCETFVPKKEVIWSIKCWKGNKVREIGFLTTAELEKYVKEGRVEKSLSSDICTPHLAEAIAEGSLEMLEKKALNQWPKGWEELTEGVLHGIKLHKKFLKKKTQR